MPKQTRESRASATPNGASSTKRPSSKKALRALRELDVTPAESLITGDTTSAEKFVRDGMKSLFDASKTLGDKSGLRFPVAKLMTEEKFSDEQIWGQLNLLHAPILHHIGETLDTRQRALQAEAAPEEEAEEEEDYEEEDFEEGMDEELSEAMSGDDAVLDEIEGTAGKKKKAKAGGSDWQYAFGKGIEDDEEIGGEASGEEDEEIEGGLKGRYPRGDTGDDYGEEGEEAEEEGEDLEDERAAMEELYGKDNVYDDEALEGGEGDNNSHTSFVSDELDEGELEGEAEADTQWKQDEQKRQREIRDAEEKRLYGAHWSMKGEVAASTRPIDSLIDETLDFEHAMKPVPIATDHSTLQLEDRIKKRIFDDNFDDVERKAPMSTAQDLFQTKRDANVEAQKSKMSLMDLYEKEFMDKQKAAEDASGMNANVADALTEIEKDELQAIQMWRRLSQHLDALSNFFYTPKPVNQDVEARVRAVQDQAPAISLESKGLTGLSREDAVAPQDLLRYKKQKFFGVTAQEMDPAEKRALRRAKKTSAAETEKRKERQKTAMETASKKRRTEEEAHKQSAGREGKRRGGKA